MSEKFQTKKSLGQNFLNSDVVPRWMCEAGAVGAGQVVLEIGPGTGALTAELLNRGAMVKAIETDERAIEALKQRFPAEIASGQLAISAGDMREISVLEVAKIFDLRDHAFKLIANIPYYLSGFLFRSFLESKLQPNTVVFLVQKEVASRIARDQKESLLSLSVKAFGTPSYIRTVGRGHFNPSPKIDSAIIKITDVNRNNFTDFDSKQFFAILQLGFGQKRKQLLGNLTAVYDRGDLETVFTKLNLALNTRAEDVPLPVWFELTKQLTALVHKK